MNTQQADGLLVRTVSTMFDARNRPVTINTGGSVFVKQLDNNGNITRQTDPNGTTTLNTYRLTASSDPHGGITRFTYDKNDQLTRVTAPNGTVTAFENDLLGRTTAETGPDRGRRTSVYDRTDNVIRITDARSVTADLSYDALKRVTAITYSDAAENVTFTYDSCPFGTGRLCSRSDQSGTDTFAYDAFGNRITETHAELGVTYTMHYTYDAGDNLVAMTLPSGRQITYTRDPVQRIQSITSTVNGTERTLNYNNASRLYQVFDNGVLTATYIYNGDGLRTRKVTAAGAFLYHYNQQGKLVSETREDGTLIREYIWQDNEPVAQIDVRENAESLTYLHADHLTTPRLATDANGTVVWRWEGEAFGRTLANEDPDGNGQSVVVNLRFPGQYYDQETGLHYNGFRYYSPETGRYLTADPIGLNGGVNLYGYVNGNPLVFTDPKGELAELVVAAAAVIVVVAIFEAVNTTIDAENTIQQKNQQLSDFMRDPNSVNANDLQQGQREVLGKIGDTLQALDNLNGSIGSAEDALTLLPVCRVR